MDERRRTKTRSFEPFRDVLEIVSATSGKQKKIPTDQRGDAFDEGGAPYVGILVEDGDVRSVRRCSGDLVEQSLVRFLIEAVNDIAQENEIVAASGNVLFLEIAFQQIDSLSHILRLRQSQPGTLEADEPVEDGRFQVRMFATEFDAVQAM